MLEEHPVVLAHRRLKARMHADRAREIALLRKNSDLRYKSTEIALTLLLHGLAEHMEHYGDAVELWNDLRYKARKLPSVHLVTARNKVYRIERQAVIPALDKLAEERGKYILSSKLTPEDEERVVELAWRIMEEKGLKEELRRLAKNLEKALCSVRASRYWSW